MIVGQHIQWNTLCDAPNLHSILNKKLDDFIIATDPTYGTGELTYYYQVDYYNSDIIISVYQYVDGCFSKINSCGYNNNRVQTVSLVTPTSEPQTETCCTQQSPVQCVTQQPTIPIPSATNDHTKLINKNADANFQHVTLAEKEKWNTETDVLGTALTGLTEATTKTNLESTDTVIGAFGKIKKWFSSLKALAFLDKVDYTKDIDNIPTDLVQDANYVHTDNNYTNADAQIVANTSGTNTGDQDLTPYLLADSTLQTGGTPEDTSLFSFWKIGVGRLKIAWSDLLNTISHNQLMGLDWLTSGHTGSANKIFGSDALGVAKEYALTDFGGAKRLVVQNSKGSNLIFLGADIKPILNGTKLCCCTSTNSYIYTIDSIGGVTLTATLATSGAAYVRYLSAIDEFHVLALTGGVIFVINGTTNVLNPDITISTATANTRNVYAVNGDFEYYSVASVRLNQRNIITGVITENAAIDYAGIYGLCAFTHENVNYIALSMYDKVRIYSESLVYISQVVLGDTYYGTLRYFDGKLYLSSSFFAAGSLGERLYIIDLANINSPTFIKKQISCGKTLFFTDYFIHETEISAQRGTGTILNLRSYDMEIVDSLPIYIPANGMFSDEGLICDSVNNNVIWIIPNNYSPLYGKIMIIKVK